MERWRTVQERLEEFRRYLAPDFPCLEIKEGYDYEWSYGPEWKSACKTKRFDPCGVYLIYDGAGTLLYVGKADWFYKRMLKHEDVPDKRFIDLICFAEEHSPFVLALETFLIQKLTPPGNTNGTGRRRKRKEEAPDTRGFA